MSQNKFNKFKVIKNDSFSGELIHKLLYNNDYVNLKTLSNNA